MTVRHFVRLADLSRDELLQILQRASELKQQQKRGEPHATCANKTLAMIFELHSTRTRVSFETGISQLGGSAIFLSPADSQLGRGEPIADTAKVLSQMVDIVMVRAQKHRSIEEFARNSSVPVINGMSDELHPCQVLADLQTYVDARGPIQGRTVAFIGDGYNMCQSYMEAAHVLDFKLRIAHPLDYGPSGCYQDAFRVNVSYSNSPQEAVVDADLVVTDVWSSMGHESEGSDRLKAFEGFQVTERLLDRAKQDTLFMHCLPAHRGEEVNETVLDDPRSVVWEEAGNRLHSQKALMEFLLASAT